MVYFHDWGKKLITDCDKFRLERLFGNKLKFQ